MEREVLTGVNPKDMSSRIDRYLINMSPGSTEFWVCMAQLILGVWLLVGNVAPAYFILGAFAPFWVWGLATVVASTMHLVASLFHNYAMRKVLSFVSFCMWTFFAIMVTLNPIFNAPPYAFLFVAASGWVYVKLTRSQEE
jgi:hypothetical protein